jgi:hypothetical protein
MLGETDGEHNCMEVEQRRRSNATRQMAFWHENSESDELSLHLIEDHSPLGAINYSRGQQRPGRVQVSRHMQNADQAQAAKLELHEGHLPAPASMSDVAPEYWLAVFSVHKRAATQLHQSISNCPSRSPAFDLHKIRRHHEASLSEDCSDASLASNAPGCGAQRRYKSDHRRKVTKGRATWPGHRAYVVLCYFRRQIPCHRIAGLRSSLVARPDCLLGTLGKSLLTHSSRKDKTRPCMLSLRPSFMQVRGHAPVLFLVDMALSAGQT